MQIAVQTPVTREVAAILASDPEQAQRVLEAVHESMDKACDAAGRRRKGRAHLVGQAETAFGMTLLDFRAQTRALR